MADSDDHFFQSYFGDVVQDDSLRTLALGLGLVEASSVGPTPESSPSKPSLKRPRSPQLLPPSPKKPSLEHLSSLSILIEPISDLDIDPGSSSSSRSDTGLRRFALRVCEKLVESKVSTYQRIADEIVSEVAQSDQGKSYHEKNVRRRVYDALNVLRALGAVHKSANTKVIRWIGLPRALV